MKPPVLAPGQSYASVTDHLAALVLRRPLHRGWLLAEGAAAALLGVLFVSAIYVFANGVGVWGVNIPVAWGFAIVNFVWWIGIGHAGTLISAFLLLMRQRWRTSINRLAEAMTIFAVCCAGIMPLMHLGRPWFFYWLLPYPNTMGLWPQWRSPLVWDVFAVSTYLLVSVMFWYAGLLPDLATLRDRARGRFKQVAFGILCLGWRGDARHWARYESAYMLLAGLATPLVISVHSIVSLDFAMEIVPGWHATIFPPYFVAGALFSGFAMVLTLVIPARKLYGLEAYITPRHLDVMAKLMLATGLLVAYGYLSEAFMAWLSHDPYAHPTYWSVLACNVVVPQLLWLQRVRTSALALFVIGLVANVGMWLERYMIVVGSLSHGYMPSRWHGFTPTLWDWGVLAGSIGLFFFLFFLFLRLLPMISIYELRELVHETGGGGA